MKIIINGKEFTKAEMDTWKKKRIKKVLRNLKKDITVTDDVGVMCDEITKLKAEMSYEEITSKIKLKLAVGQIGMKLAAAISRGKRRSSVTTIYADGITVEKLGKMIDALMLEDTEEHRFANLAACPDHYVLSSRNGTLEVIETAGNTPVPTQFFITFND